MILYHSETVTPDEFVVTTVSIGAQLNPMEMSLTCLGCSGFCESLLIIDQSRESNANGWCVHSLSIPAIMSTLTNSNIQDESTSAFVQFVKLECASTLSSECTLLTRHLPRSRYLVITTVEEARADGVPRHSVCTQTQVANSWSVHCNSVKCKRGKNKMIKNIKSVDDVCCHIRKLLSRSDPTTSADIALDNEDEENAGDKQLMKHVLCFHLLLHIR